MGIRRRAKQRIFAEQADEADDATATAAVHIDPHLPSGWVSVCLLYPADNSLSLHDTHTYLRGM